MTPGTSPEPMTDASQWMHEYKESLCLCQVNGGGLAGMSPSFPQQGPAQYHTFH